jgi:hypothetical protein
LTHYWRWSSPVLTLRVVCRSNQISLLRQNPQDAGLHDDQPAAFLPRLIARVGDSFDNGAERRESVRAESRRFILYCALRTLSEQKLPPAMQPPAVRLTHRCIGKFRHFKTRNELAVRTSRHPGVVAELGLSQSLTLCRYSPEPAIALASSGSMRATRLFCWLTNSPARWLNPSSAPTSSSAKRFAFSLNGNRLRAGVGSQRCRLIPCL